ncbi:hypothetical protein F5884DRAFT_513376 [Xylogone sp. PMI_703]|nr:hypothetical protein F5884DRAFT_513376 [Xylogone sp. PMI_703]
MRALSTLCSVGALVCVTVAQATASEILAQIPSCTLNCGVKLLDPVKCPFDDIHAVSNCLCKSETIQKELAICVLSTCNPMEQAVSMGILQDDVCVGYPVPSRSADLIRDIIIIAAVTFPVVALRFVARRMVVSKFWWDDLAIVLSALIMIPMTFIPIYNATRGFGKHFWNVPAENIAGLRKLYYISQIMYGIVQALAKFSILFLYLRIFMNVRFRRFAKFAIAWMVCHTIAVTFAIAFQCVPVVSIWDVTVEGKCINSQAFVYTLAALAIFEDIVIIVMPIYELKDLNLDLRKKIALMLIFVLGSFACVTSMIRLKYIISYGTSLDQTYDNVDVIIWSVLETFMAIICASMMCFRPLLVKIFPLLFHTSKATSGNAAQNNRWSHKFGSRLTSRIRSDSQGIELRSEDGEGREILETGIRVEKMWTINSVEVERP